MKTKKTLLDSRWAYKGRVIGLKVDTYQAGDRTYVREIVQHPGAVVIIPVDDKGRILLIRQFRTAANEALIELPAGTLEEKELPEDCAFRELQEETGFSAKKMTSMGGFFSTPGFCNEYLHLFVAEDLHPSKLKGDVDEEIKLMPTSFEKAIQMIQEGKISDGKTIAGIFKYQIRYNK